MQIIVQWNEHSLKENAYQEYQEGIPYILENI